MKDSVLMNDTPETIMQDFEILKGLRKSNFDQKFSKVFNLNKERFEQDETLKAFKEQGLQFSKEALSNLLGGFGYYYGPVQIKAGNSKYYDTPAALFTGSPSRSRFPRGFLWDEGFHLMLTC
jgi:mannosyl-oligosaccharide glucosidase